MSKGIEVGGLGTDLVKYGIVSRFWVSMEIGVGGSNTDLVGICEGDGTD